MPKRSKPQSLIVTVKSEPEGLVDLEIIIKRGGQLNIELEGGPESDESFQLSLYPRDQRRWIIDKNGMRPCEFDS